MGYRYIIADIISNKELKTLNKGNYSCPFCVESTSNSVDIGWVETKIPLNKPKYICRGCAIDLYAECLTEDFDNYSDESYSKDVADKISMDIRDFRLIILQHQKELVSKELVKHPSDADLIDLNKKISLILGSMDI